MLGLNLLAFLPTGTERATSAMETWVPVINCPDFLQVDQQGAPKQRLSLPFFPATAEEVSAGK